MTVVKQTSPRGFPRVVVGILCASLTVLAILGTPGVAAAHSIGPATNLSVWEFVPLGITHMIMGWDHLLFIAGVVLLAGGLGRAAKLISLFAVGHSTTLIAATVVGLRVDATVVDVVIALSVVLVGVMGFTSPPDWHWFGATVTVFGLIHGVGLATRLQDLGLPHENQLSKVIAFNVGVEIGQLFAITAMIMLGHLFTRTLTWTGARRWAHAGMIATGVVAAIVLTIDAATGSGDVSPTAVAAHLAAVGTLGTEWV